MSMSRKRKNSDSLSNKQPLHKRRKTDEDNLEARKQRILEVYRNRFTQLFVLDNQDPEHLEQMDRHLQHLQKVGDVDNLHAEYERVCAKLHLNPGRKYYGGTDEVMPNADEIVQEMTVEDELVTSLKQFDFEMMNVDPTSGKPSFPSSGIKSAMDCSTEHEMYHDLNMM